MANMATTERTPTKGIDINANATKSRTAVAEATPKSPERRIEDPPPGSFITFRDVQTEM
jgi:hypothetical protein